MTGKNYNNIIGESIWDDINGNVRNTLLNKVPLNSSAWDLTNNSIWGNVYLLVYNYPTRLVISQEIKKSLSN